MRIWISFFLFISFFTPRLALCEKIESKPFWELALNSVSKKDKEVLEFFFRTLLEDSYGGYVVFGSKPVLHESIFPQEGTVQSELYMSFKHDRLAAIFKKGIKILNALPYKSQNYLTAVYKTPVYGAQEVAFINKKSLKQVIRENFTLFQYALGPEVTFEKLWSRLENEDENFFSIFKNDRVLFGIVLGYGTENALRGSRQEYIHDCLIFSKYLLPLKSNRARELISLKKTTPDKDTDDFFRNFGTSPSFGFGSLKEEREFLQKKEFLSLDTQPLSKPTLPWFGCYPCEETNKILHAYLEDHKKIQNLLHSENFLAEVFKILFAQADKKPLQQKKKELLSAFKAELLGQAIWQSLPDHSELYISNFLKGFQATNTSLDNKEYYHLFMKRLQAGKTLKAKRNLQKTSQFFDTLKNQQDLVSVVSGKVYYKKLKAGKGKDLSSLRAKVLASYHIETIEGEILYQSHEATEALPLTEVMSGLAQAMLGMKEGEKREIFIHPEYGYQYNFEEMSDLEDNLALCVTTQLKEIVSQEEGVVSYEPIKLLAVDRTEQELLQSYEELQKQFSYQYGVRVRQYYQLAEADCAIDQVAQELQLARKGKHIDLSKEEIQDFLVDLKWNAIGNIQENKGSL